MYDQLASCFPEFEFESGKSVSSSSVKVINQLAFLPTIGRLMALISVENNR
jgi:hypothetical protein